MPGVASQALSNSVAQMTAFSSLPGLYACGRLNIRGEGQDIRAAAGADHVFCYGHRIRLDFVTIGIRMIEYGPKVLSMQEVTAVGSFRDFEIAGVPTRR